MSVLPTPTHIQRRWEGFAMALTVAAAELRRYGAPEDWGEPVEHRAWREKRPPRPVKRIDAAYANGRTASVRFSGGFYTMRFGAGACR